MIEEHHVYHEVPVEGRPRLGRHLHRDPRSLAYTVDLHPAIQPAEHVSPIPVLNQARLGSCVGNASTAHLAERAFGANVRIVKLGTRLLVPSGSADDDELFAVEVYHEATELDGVDPYPPGDPGTSGLSACKVLRAAGCIASYRWATSLAELASLLMDGSCIIGMPWMEGFFSPDANGFVDSGSWGSLAGGHETCIEALETWDDSDPGKVVLRVRNSWGESWGVNGRFRLRGSTYERLVDQIDVKQFVM